MPIYEYQCGACGHAFEAIQKFSEDPLTDCPSCSEVALKKLMSAPAFRLKGEGWYETDFKSSNKRNLASSSGSDGGGDSGGSSSSGAESAKSDAGSANKSSDKSADSKPAKSSTASTTATPAKSTKTD